MLIEIHSRRGRAFKMAAMTSFQTVHTIFIEISRHLAMVYMTKMHCLFGTRNFVGFLVIRNSQGSVATYVRYGGMSYTPLYSIFPNESVSERIIYSSVKI